MLLVVSSISRDLNSRIVMSCDSNGCISIPIDAYELRFVVKSPYYKSDTITRIIQGSGSENVRLHTNDYALMVHIFSNSKVSDWEKRRQQLDDMFDNNVEIYQIDVDQNVGVELYNKTDFINKMTMPIKSLKNIEVIETIYQGNKIIQMRFRQKESQ